MKIIQVPLSRRGAWMELLAILCISIAGLPLSRSGSLHAQEKKVAWTCCPPCRKEMPDLETLYREFKDQNFVILAISDEDAGKVKPFVAKQKVTYPILLDPGRKVHELFRGRRDS
jgi:thiol-disulfide isomerase/thioredoxin